VTPDPTPPAVPAVQDEPRHDVYVRLRDGEVAKTREPWEGVQVDLDAQNVLVGFEFLAAQAVDLDGHLAVPRPEVARLQAIVDRVGYDPETDSWRLDGESQEHMDDLWEQVQAMQVSRDRYAEQVLAIAKALGLDRDADGSRIIAAARKLRTLAAEAALSNKVLRADYDELLRQRTQWWEHISREKAALADERDEARAERDQLREQIEASVQDWEANDAGVLADSQRLHEANERLAAELVEVKAAGMDMRVARDQAKLAALRASTVAPPRSYVIDALNTAVHHGRYRTEGYNVFAAADELLGWRAPTVGDTAQAEQKWPWLNDQRPEPPSGKRAVNLGPMDASDIVEPAGPGTEGGSDAD
jgi:uncharacterized protein YuzE